MSNRRLLSSNWLPVNRNNATDLETFASILNEQLTALFTAADAVVASDAAAALAAAIAATSTAGWIFSLTSLLPDTWPTHSLGSSGAPLLQVFSNFLSSGTGAALAIQYGGATFATLDSATQLTPTDPDTAFLGSSANAWNTVYTNRVSSSGGAPLSFLHSGTEFGYLRSSTSFVPTSGGRSLGDTVAGLTFAGIYSNILSSGSGTPLTIQYGGSTFANLTSSTLLTPAAAGKSLGAVGAGLTWAGVYTDILSSGSGTTLAIQYGGATFANLTSSTLLTPAASGKSLGAVGAGLTWAGVYTNILSSGTGTALTLQYGGTAFANLTSSTLLTPAAAGKYLGAVGVGLTWGGVYTNILSSGSGTTLTIQYGGSTFANLSSSTLLAPASGGKSLGTSVLAWANVYSNVIKSGSGVSLSVSSDSAATAWLFRTTGELAPAGTGVLDVGTASFRVRRLETKHAPRVEGDDTFCFSLPEFYRPGQDVTTSYIQMWRFVRDSTTALSVPLIEGFRLPFRVFFTGLTVECDNDAGVETAQTWTFEVTANGFSHCSGSIAWTPANFDSKGMAFTTWSSDSIAADEEIKVNIRKSSAGANFRDITVKLHCSPGRRLA